MNPHKQKKVVLFASTADRRVILYSSCTSTVPGPSPVCTARHPSCLFFSPWRWHRPDALNEELFVLPYASTCNRFLGILPNFALCQQGPHVSTKESLASGKDDFVIWLQREKKIMLSPMLTRAYHCFTLLSLCFFFHSESFALCTG